MADPNPRVAGGGRRRPLERGDRGGARLLESSKRSSSTEHSSPRSEPRRPHVTLKWAATLDGKIADGRSATSKWITGPGARLEAHRLRSRSDAIIVGIGTALADDPGPRREAGHRRGRASRCAWWWTARRDCPSTARVIRGSEGTGRPERAVVAVADAADPERRRRARGTRGHGPARARATTGALMLSICSRGSARWRRSACSSKAAASSRAPFSKRASSIAWRCFVAPRRSSAAPPRRER